MALLERVAEAAEGLRSEAEAIVDERHPDCAHCRMYQRMLDALAALDTEVRDGG